MDILDCWEQEDFEDLVSAALIATYETKIKNKPEVKQKDLAFLRKVGVYLPSNSREMLYDPNTNMVLFDPSLDGLPNQGYIGRSSKAKYKSCDFEGYFSGSSFRAVEKLPAGFTRCDGGKLYKQVIIFYGDKSIDGRLGYFTIKKDGKITACQHHGHNRDGKFTAEKDYILKEIEQDAALSLTEIADARFCWSIKAEEAEAKVTVGCMMEEIKSLLYARSLPTTATGRKRPILHLVEAHKRRIKNGVDIDVTKFLRGTQKIEMNGTVFTVTPPKVMINSVSKKSERYFL